MFQDIKNNTPIEHVTIKNGVHVDIKRLDQIHPYISGNKFYKLKYNLIEAKQQGYSQILTFGGAYSNHIAATAYAAKYYNFKSIGIIRGEELANQPLNHTLSFAHDACQMQLSFVSRSEYKMRDQYNYLEQLKAQYPNIYIIPEGGTNAFAIEGCKEILKPSETSQYDIICCAVGTGGTLLGLIQSTPPSCKILGFSALKGDFLAKDLKKLTTKTHWHITDEYCFGGYAKTSPELISFIKWFETAYGMPLEPIYTGKMCYGIFDLINQSIFPQGTKILLIHTGGLQGKSSLM
ncbi:1-aminocyclopropane-1-carboxylate deaminase/D-cysteine desulfhydrase [Acinetobacter pollinis]|jgi:1-aminocyclopropane-1-carboxylate deaminase|uniref:1-aminocyclopropane-1-carboxylate deaminase/D-cysteine desulfhydrase n=1 Tax=Acinetobacter pollinis TaxID=2605270 RepID=A0ABU6DP36_9GAMM|nr:pyridoxal-phosphate dependent enzyme [Acinetobacter pollinis]MBF7689872.1 1-aminocyclopropane-1-carboxylate deaminase/D-cysteine desulfhydrase [Acinetobacter pollinis]MBF7692451.1 1-aminocyclopropane-1-carboxylate deaminase/D-cysteine desulfhydrase [Acinetobacter pollinis]MBF7697276.1 1-aminocyclopropane-1-carboxylate deaminase/D-cysteine desulfhydrase [Acinetobacter pollinis]MBF7701153.1 1-aminocyclopropane-1-carboxylate deaminase/D-cysteine desulfhydrase [Acinetobacter pollinis]MEB5475617